MTLGAKGPSSLRTPTGGPFYLGVILEAQDVGCEVERDGGRGRVD